MPWNFRSVALLPHVNRGGPRERHHQNLPAVDPKIRCHMVNPAEKRRGLAAPGTGDQDHLSINFIDRLILRGVPKLLCHGNLRRYLYQ